MGTIDEGLRTAVEEDHNRLLTDLVQIAQHPAPPGNVEERVDFLEERFQQFPVDSVYRDPHENLVVHRKDREGPSILLTVNLESPFDRSVDHTVHIDDRYVRGPGVVDNALGLASLLSVARILESEESLNVLLVATANERTSGSRRKIRGVVEDATVEIGTALCLEGKGLGRIDHRSLGTNEMTVVVEGPESTSWPEEPVQNPIEVMGRIIEQLSELRDQLDSGEQDVHINLGEIQGGASAETVPYECKLRFQLRSRSNQRLVEIRQQVHQSLEPVRERTEFPIKIRETLREPAGEIERDHWLVEMLSEIHQELGITSRYGATSSDASIFLDEGIPALTLGLGEEEHVYREEEQLNLESLRPGQLQLMGAVRRINQRLQ